MRGRTFDRWSCSGIRAVTARSLWRLTSKHDKPAMEGYGRYYCGILSTGFRSDGSFSNLIRNTSPNYVVLMWIAISIKESISNRERTLKAVLTPPLSAMFSPSDNCPLRWTPASSTRTDSYWCTKHLQFQLSCLLFNFCPAISIAKDDWFCEIFFSYLHPLQILNDSSASVFVSLHNEAHTLWELLPFETHLFFSWNFLSVSASHHSFRLPSSSYRPPEYRLPYLLPFPVETTVSHTAPFTYPESIAVSPTVSNHPIQSATSSSIPTASAYSIVPYPHNESIIESCTVPSSPLQYPTVLTLVIERVGHFVSDHSAHHSVRDVVRHADCQERKLHYSRREYCKRLIDR